MRLLKVLKITAAVVAIAAVVVVGLVVGLLMFGGAPMKDGSALADGKVTVVVDRMGPVRIGAYVLALAQGGFALVDAGQDPEAKAIVAALGRKGAGPDDVRAVFFTHAHSDHAQGARAFPRAELFALEADAAALRRGGFTVTGLADGERATVSGTAVEAFAVPGHTPGSAAYLVEGVLFLGDAAASISESQVAPNDFAYTQDAAQNHRSLRALAARLEARRSDVVAMAFGHQGPVHGLGPLLEWAATPGRGAP